MLPSCRTVIAWVCLASLMMAGCVAGPSTPVLEGTALQRLLALHQREQSSRRAQLQQWLVQGFFDFESENGGRRHRLVVRGEGDRRARVRVFGPFQQIVLSLWLGEEEIHFLDANRKETVIVPSNARGLAYLTGIWMEPRRLIEVLTGLGGGEGIRGDSSDDLMTATGERLRLDGASGRILERSRHNVSGYSWSVVYTWPTTAETTSRQGVHPVMPDQVDITLKPARSRLNGEESTIKLKYRLKKWQLPSEPFAGEWFTIGRLPPGYRTVRPESGGKSR